VAPNKVSTANINERADRNVDSAAISACSTIYQGALYQCEHASGELYTASTVTCRISVLERQTNDGYVFCLVDAKMSLFSFTVYDRFFLALNALDLDCIHFEIAVSRITAGTHENVCEIRGGLQNLTPIQITW
jgi:hypothetical protein